MHQPQYRGQCSKAETPSRLSEHGTESCEVHNSPRAGPIQSVYSKNEILKMASKLGNLIELDSEPSLDEGPGLAESEHGDGNPAKHLFPASISPQLTVRTASKSGGACSRGPVSQEILGKFLQRGNIQTFFGPQAPS